MNDFQDLVAIVTGGASGIGAATAALLRQRGARVAVFDRDPRGVPAGLLALTCDVTDKAAVRLAMSTVARELGGVDVLINNAGIGATGNIAANDDREWAHVLDVNVAGIARVTRAALPHLRNSRHATIVNMCSAVAYVGVRERALYAATKGAVAALTLAMAADHVAEGIRVNAVAPGTSDTPWVGRLLEASDDPEASAAALRARQPLGRLVSAEEVAHAVASLASPFAGAVTGEILRVDGGMSSLRL
jgi:NAD(P)-dependent dehydrogenase (short-subunit alcohol dehydrogenase family)